jgi:hypothetical protein
MKRILTIYGFLLISVFVLFPACEREELTANDPESILLQAENETVAEAVLQSIEDQIDKEINRLENAGYNPLLLKSAEAGNCDPVVTVKTPEKSAFPKTITLDYGSGCTDTEGNLRAGKVVVQITGPYWEKNTVRNAKLEDYRFNDLKVKGDRKEVNKGTNSEGYYHFEVDHSLTFTKADNGELICDRDWKRSRIYDRGNNLESNEDDQVWVTGSAKVDKKDVSMLKEITVTLYRKLTCAHFMSGVITTTINKEKVAALDYGKEGECDDKATWKNLKTGKTKEISLKKGVNWFSVKK